MGKDEPAENLTWEIVAMLFLSSILCHELWEGCNPFSGELSWGDTRGDDSLRWKM